MGSKVKLCLLFKLQNWIKVEGRLIKNLTRNFLNHVLEYNVLVFKNENKTQAVLLSSYFLQVLQVILRKINHVNY